MTKNLKYDPLEVDTHIQKCGQEVQKSIDAMKAFASTAQNPFLLHAILMEYTRVIYRELARVLMADRRAFYNTPDAERPPEDVMDRLYSTHMAIGNSVCHLHALVHEDIEALAAIRGRDLASMDPSILHKC